MVYAIIYKTTNLINGKIYVGQRLIKDQSTLDDKYLGSGGRHLKRAFKKYGLENFKREVLHHIFIPNQKAVDALEKHYIKKHDSTNLSIGYNKLLGTSNNFGSGSPMKNPDVAKRVTDKLRGRKGAKRSEAGKANMKKAAQKSWEDAQWRRDRVSEFVKSTMTPEHREYLSNLAKKRVFTQSRKDKISLNHADFSGEKHPCFGIRYDWITDGCVNKRLNKGLDMPEGFYLGKIQVNSTKHRR